MKKMLLLIGLLLTLATNLNAQTTHVVENTDDAGTGSLRQASIDAVSGDTIRFNPNLISGGNAMITLTTGNIDFGAKGIVIKGLYNAMDTLFISGDNNSRIFAFSGAGEVVLDSLVLINGNGTGSYYNDYGGAVTYVLGTEYI